MAKTVRSVSTEFVIVVVGVLVALAADSAVGRLRDEDTRLASLRSLRDDIAQDLDQLESSRLPFLEEKREADQLLRTFLNGNEGLQDSVAFVHAVALVTTFSTFDATTTTIEDLTSSGTLRLIEDPQLRRIILAYYNLTEDVRDVDAFSRSAAIELDRSLSPRIVGGLAHALAVEAQMSSSPRNRLGSYDPGADAIRAAAATALDGRQIRTNGALRELLVGSARGLAYQWNNYGLLRDRARAALEALDSAIASG